MPHLTPRDGLHEENDKSWLKYLAEGTVWKPENFYVNPKGISISYILKLDTDESQTPNLILPVEELQYKLNPPLYQV